MHIWLLQMAALIRDCAAEAAFWDDAAADLAARAALAKLSPSQGQARLLALPDLPAVLRPVSASASASAVPSESKA